MNVDESGRDLLKRANDLRLPILAKAYLRELWDVLTRGGNIIKDPHDRDRSLYVRDWHWEDLRSPSSYDQLSTLLETLPLVRCRPELALTALVGNWLFPQLPIDSSDVIIRRWLRGITATRWVEYTAYGFEHFQVDQAFVVKDRLKLIPARLFRPPPWESLADRYREYEISSVRTWAVLQEQVTSPYPDSFVRHYPFPDALYSAIGMIVSPLLTPTWSIHWDGPTPIRRPIFVNYEESRLEGVARFSPRTIILLRKAYSAAAAKRGTYIWRGWGFPEKLDRLRIAESYLQISYKPGAHFSEAFVSIATCLEALVGPDVRSELTNRLSQRVALLSGLDDEDARDVSRHVKALYDLRSAVLHTGGLIEKKAKSILKSLAPSVAPPGRLFDASVFNPALNVSIEIARRAIYIASQIEQSCGKFEPDSLDEALFDQELRRRLRRLIRRTIKLPIRKWWKCVLDKDFVRIPAPTR